MGCNGGAFQNAYNYVLNNSGLDSEKDYPYVGYDEACWTNASKRVVASISNYSAVPQQNDAQLEAFVSKGPVAVAIEADQSIFQSYKSGVITNATACGTKLDHGVLGE